MKNQTKEQGPELKEKNDQLETNQAEEKLDDTVMPDKKPKKKFFKSLLITLILIIGILTIIFFALKDQNKQSAYSENQERVIANFGLPQTYKIATQNGEKLEYWRYIYLDEIFIFQNGKFIARQHFNFDIEENQGVYLQLEPSSFYDQANITDINQLLDTEPSLEAEIDAEILGPDYKFYSYSQLLNITTQQNSIVVIDSLALKSTSDEDSKPPVESQTDKDQSTTEKEGKIFIANSESENASFSYYLNDPSYRYIKQRKLITDSEEETMVYGYCYTLDEGASFTDEPQDPYACADNESMLWTISIYKPTTFANLDEISKSYEQKLFSNEQNIFTISHANGDFPETLPMWSVILDDIKDDFSVPMADEYRQMIQQ
jgi:hypothetical protein